MQARSSSTTGGQGPRRVAVHSTGTHGPRVQGPILVVARSSAEPLTERLRSVLERGWPTLVIDDPSRAAWVAGVRRPVAVVLLGGLDPWTSNALAMLRRATAAALVV